jgi:hypothetical protein
MLASACQCCTGSVNMRNETQVETDKNVRHYLQTNYAETLPHEPLHLANGWTDDHNVKWSKPG